MDEYVNQIKVISGEIWKFFKAAIASWNPDDEKWWNGLISLADDCIIKYKNTDYEQYVRDYALAIMNEIERKAKNDKKRN